MSRKRQAYEALSMLSRIPGNEEVVEELWEQAQRLFHRAANSWRAGRDIMLFLSADGCILDGNGVLEEQLCQPRGWAAGQSLWKLISVERRERVRAIVKSVVSLGRPVTYLAHLPRGPATVTISPVLGHGVQGSVLMIVHYLPCRLWQFGPDAIEDGLKEEPGVDSSPYDTP
jgi:hypothetical protein